MEQGIKRIELPRRKLIRLNSWDYSSKGWYYVTICTHGRRLIFGKINNGEMILNETGRMVNKQWREIAKHFLNVKLDIWQIMPNHIHGIIVINDCLQSAMIMKPTLGQIVAYFKYQSTKQLNNIFPFNKMYGRGIPALTKTGAKTAPLRKIWQRNYYEHIIRNEKSLNQIRQYIKNNPIFWIRDENNLSKIKE